MVTAPDKLGFGALMGLALESMHATGNCSCGIAACRGWTRVPPDFPHAQMLTVGTLLDDPYAEPTYAELHQGGTTYWSPDAPIAIHYYPYNRCAVLQCSVCGRVCLSYVEAGGYYVEPRIRALDPALLVDADPVN